MPESNAAPLVKESQQMKANLKTIEEIKKEKLGSTVKEVKPDVQPKISAKKIKLSDAEKKRVSKVVQNRAKSATTMKTQVIATQPVTTSAASATQTETTVANTVGVPLTTFFDNVALTTIPNMPLTTVPTTIPNTNLTAVSASYTPMTTISTTTIPTVSKQPLTATTIPMTTITNNPPLTTIPTTISNPNLTPMTTISTTTIPIVSKQTLTTIPTTTTPITTIPNATPLTTIPTSIQQPLTTIAKVSTQQNPLAHNVQQ